MCRSGLPCCRPSDACDRPYVMPTPFRYCHSSQPPPSGQNHCKQTPCCALMEVYSNSRRADPPRPPARYGPGSPLWSSAIGLAHEPSLADRSRQWACKDRRRAATSPTAVTMTGVAEARKRSPPTDSSSPAVSTPPPAAASSLPTSPPTVPRPGTPPQPKETPWAAYPHRRQPPIRHPRD